MAGEPDGEAALDGADRVEQRGSFGEDVDVDEPSVEQRRREVVVLVPPGDELGDDQVVRVEAPSDARAGVFRLERDEPVPPPAGRVAVMTLTPCP